MKLDQVAFGCKTLLKWKEMSEKCSVIDHVTFDGELYYDDVKIRIRQAIGHLAFQYKMGIEVEYLYYPQLGTFHDLLGGEHDLFLSHLAFHVISIKYYISNLAMEFGPDSKIVMDVTTTNHTNEKLQAQGRHYRYLIIDTRASHGYFTKLIERI
jgi:hypothetical protein